MTSKEFKYGIFKKNELLKELSKGRDQRTALLGQIVKIEGISSGGNVNVRFLKEDESWESISFCCPKDNIEPIHEALWQFFQAIPSPQERVKLAKNKDRCEKLLRLTKDVTVGFNDINDILLGTIKYIGHVRGMGRCYGVELHEKKKNNNCDGSCAGTQYFYCLPGFGLFTTIEKIIPSPMSYDASTSQNSTVSDLDRYLEKNLSSISSKKDEIDSKPPYEHIVTTYGEYSKKSLTMPSRNSYLRTSLSLQNIFDNDSYTINTNNDFDQNTVIQPEKTNLIHTMQKKPKNKSEMDLIDIIGEWSGTTDSKHLESYSNLKKNLDKNDNIKEKTNHTTMNNVGYKTAKNKITLPVIESNNSLNRKSTFYLDYVENDKDKYHSRSKKEENHKKFNEKSEQLPRSTFYVNDKPKYHDPLPGTTNDLSVGSLVEVSNDVAEKPLYGVVRWMGVENGTNYTLVGVELDEEYTNLPLTLTDGTHNGERFFKCADNRALFVPIQQCHKDSRFQDGIPIAVPQASDQRTECPVIPGAVAPLCMPTEEDVEAVCAKYRGIQGHHNSCYLDVTLFSMFTYTAVFDSLLFRPKNPNDIDDYEEVQRVLREEIVNPLRKNLFVSADHVMKLRKLLDRLSSVSGLTSEEKDPEEFLNSLLAQILKAEPFLKLNSGQEAFHYQLFVEKDADLTLPTVQQLFEQSFLTSDIKLKEVPSCLIIQMPRFGKNYKMYPRILPSQLLDVTDIIEGSPRQCIVCGKLARWECRECFDDFSNAGLESTAFCSECLRTAHRSDKRMHHRPTKLDVDHDFSIMEDHCRPPRLFMELFAVICIETSHYVAFVKCGVGHEAPWCFFDSMADREGEKNGFNIPEMVACPDVSRWLSDEGICRQLDKEYPHDRHLPEHARRLLCDAYICMYQSSDVMMYR